MNDLTVLEVIRALAIISLAIATAGMVRFYVTRRRVPHWAMLGMCLYVVALSSTVIENFSQSNFQWAQSPFVLLGSLACIRGVWPYLSLRRPPPPEEDDHDGRHEVE